MKPTPSPLAAAALCLLLVAAARARAQQDPEQGAQQNAQREAAAPDTVMRALQAELERSLAALAQAGQAPVYFLAYRLYDVQTLDLAASYGALVQGNRSERSRVLDVELRVGSPQLDNTHRLRDQGFDLGLDFGAAGMSFVPLEDDEAAIRAAVWAATDAAFKSAQERFTKVAANKAVKVEEEDTSDDFSAEEPSSYVGEAASLDVDRPAWEAMLRRLSATYRNHAFIHDSSCQFTASRIRRWLVSSEGSRIRDDRTHYRIFTTARATADDGMELWLYDGVEAHSPQDLPDEARLAAMADQLAASLAELRAAPVADPWTGPAILRPRAAGVLFHEIFGHRIEGHRQKDEEEGRTFAKKIGQRVMPEFITVIDDPTLRQLGSTPLNGYYRFDDEGVPAQKVTLVENGVLTSFLMGRSPVRDFPKSNGHGRCQPGGKPVARQGNLIVQSAKQVPYDELRAMLLAEMKRQGKAHGLVFDEIAGGFTMTQAFLPQSFKLLPLRVWRVYADGRPDEMLRGVDIVGTPLAALERILCASEETDTFNGTCGAESGWVPVSASSPSLVVETIEVERRQKEQDRPPLLPPPLHDPEELAQTKNAAGGKQEER